MAGITEKGHRVANSLSPLPIVLYDVAMTYLNHYFQSNLKTTWILMCICIAMSMTAIKPLTSCRSLNAEQFTHGNNDIHTPTCHLLSVCWSDSPTPLI